MAQQTAVEWLEQEINRRGPRENNPPQWLYEFYQQAKQMEREQHGDTWDEAIKAHEKRGNVIARSICDFDEYYTQTYGNKEPKDVVLGYKTSLDAQMLDKVGLKTK